MLDPINPRLADPGRESLLFAADARFNEAAFQVESRPLREAFARLFDQCAGEVYRMGLDLDGVVFERRLLLQSGDERWEMALDFIADDAVLRQALERNIVSHKAAVSDTIVCSIRVVVLGDAGPA